MLARNGMLLLTGLLVMPLAGCSESNNSTPVASTESADASGASAPAAPSSVNRRPSNPIAATAYEFLDAVFAGDTARADRQLTPAAAAQFAKSGQRFAPPGSGPTSFKIGEVRLLQEDQAAVECLVRGEVDGQSVEEALGCLLRKVDQRWAVVGVAYEVSPEQPPVVLNFEQPAQTSPEPEYVASPDAAQAAPRTAAGPTPAISR